MKNRTQIEQEQTESMIKNHYENILQKNNSEENDDEEPEFGHFFRQEHINYLEQSLFSLNYSIRWYDVGHPWVIYWITNGISILSNNDSVLEK
jgi:protein farnesyltransferase subunit beta